jgi:2-acylglycerol O-acyltransferase 2
VQYVWVFWLLIATLFLPAKPLLWTPFINHWVFGTWREYFHVTYLQEETLNPDKKYIMAHFPHGVIPMSEVVGSTLRPFLWPGMQIFCLGADSVFCIPFWRHFHAWMGVVPASVDSFKRFLSKGTVAVMVGGIAGR